MTQRRLTAHFTADEFASRDGVPAPPPFLRAARSLCLYYLEPLRAEFGAVTVHSGYRTAARNAEVGGAPASMHLRVAGRRGAAADVSCVRGAPADWHRFLDGLGIPGLGLYDTHVHADNRRGRARW